MKLPGLFAHWLSWICWSAIFCPGTFSPAQSEDLADSRTGDDVVVLRNGSRISGKVLNDLIQIRTSSGDIRLQRDSIATIEFGERTPPQATTNIQPDNLLFNPANLGFGSDGLVWIQPGEFLMGSPYDEVGRDRDESPQTTIIFPHGFWIGRYEVTQREYERVMGTNPSTNTELQEQPVEKVSWFEAVEYCEQLTRSCHMSGVLPVTYQFRLPTEAEWEYACRAGTESRFSFGHDKTDFELREYAWYARNSDSSTHPVGKKKPNGWGLYDMHGNVWEWCLDRWEGALPGGSITNTVNSGKGLLRVARGGSWLYESRACRSANRDDYSPGNRCADLGFRIVLARVPE